jgi:hypothetical protein
MRPTLSPGAQLSALGTGWPGSGGAVWLQTAARDWYAESRQRAAAIQAQHWQPATVGQRERLWGEYDVWSRQMLGKPGVLAVPGDLLVYFESYWLRQHGRQSMAEDMRAAPASLDAAVSHLSTRFAELGRRGAWDPVTGAGNPCLSMEMRTFKGGYHNQMHGMGFQQQSAVPMPVEKYQILLMRLIAEAEAAKAQGDSVAWQTEVLLRRDALMIGLLWVSHRRPAEAGQLLIGSVQSEDDHWTAQGRVSKMAHPSHGRRQPRPI